MNYEIFDFCKNKRFNNNYFIFKSEDVVAIARLKEALKHGQPNADVVVKGVRRAKKGECKINPPSHV